MQLDLLLKIGEFLKSKVNSIRIPRLLDFFINPNAKDMANPTLEEALKGAPDPKTNWDRLGLGTISNLGVPTWTLFAALAFVIAIYIGRSSLMFFIDIIGYAIALIPLAVLVWFLYKNYFKKK